MMPDADRPVRRLLHNTAATAESVGVTVLRKGQAMAKADGAGHYTTTDASGRVHRFKVQKGDPIPDGAQFVAAEQTDAEPAKAQQAKRGPSETSDAKGAKETA